MIGTDVSSEVHRQTDSITRKWMSKWAGLTEVEQGHVPGWVLIVSFVWGNAIIS